MKKNKIFTMSPITAPVLVILVLILLSLSGTVIEKQAGSNDIFMLISVIQLIVFVFPCIIYYFIKGRKLGTPIYLSSIKPGQILFLIFSTMLLLTGSMLINFIFYIAVDYAPSSTSQILNAFTSSEEVPFVSVFISLILIPAVCEELFFRGVILSEYRSFGTFNAVMISSICFAMIHFSFELLPLYMYTGIVLGTTAVVCRSIFAPIILHAINNFINIYASDLFLRVTIQKSSPIFVGFVLISLFLLSLILVMSRVEHIFLLRSEKPVDTSLPPRSIGNMSLVFLSPAFFALCFVFVLITILI